ncbi:class I SAM-dependent methyltransferase [Phaeospirillum tilakii]|uniref:Class I SAM-dependent methyltransferase n=1 Tax=Phaeospirillum tilakii TaxID=741673 RepID=A0ABW5CDV3_9PROT
MAATAHRAGLTALAERGAGAETIAALPDRLWRVEAISLDAIRALLADSGALPPGGPAHAPQEILAILGTAPRHAWLVRRWLAALGRRGLIAPDRDGRLGWSGPPPPKSEGAAALPEAYRALGFPPAMAVAHGAALERLAALVRDEVTLQRILFGDGDVLTALAAYQDNLFTAYLNAAAAALVATRADSGRPRLLELGGGAGLTTAATVRALGGQAAAYRFTDISRLFTSAAARRFAQVPELSCAPLDIDTDFGSQGVPPASAEIVLAGNVLHNAADIGATLRRIRQTLVPGGWLIFTESTEETDAILTAMQFLLSPPAGAPPPGGRDRRPDGHVFLDAADWTDELDAAALSPVLELPEPASPLAAAGQRLFLAQAR